jgi:glycosyltransferase involved in cell wall biosynthesis
VKKYRIIYYSSHPTHDIVSTVGYSVHQRETINSLRNLNHEVFPLIMGGVDEKKVTLNTEILYKKAEKKSLIKRMLPLFIWNALKDIQLLLHDRKAGKLLEKAIIEFKPDLIYERGEYIQDSGVKVAKRYNIKHVLEVNSPVVEEMSHFEGPDLLRFIGFIKERNKLKNTSQIVTVSSALKKYLIDFYKCQKDILVAPNAINPNRDNPSDISVSEIKNSISPQSKIIGFVGSILPYHGVDKLVRVFSTIVKKHRDIHLLIVGDGAVREYIENLAREILPPNSFTFTGNVPHKRVMNYIKSFDIGVMAASNWYGSPVKIFEYGWMGIPIIAPDNVPMRDVMVSYKDGILITESDDDLEEALLYLLNYPSEGLKMGQHFRNKILNSFTWDAQTKNIIDFLVFD